MRAPEIEKTRELTSCAPFCSPVGDGRGREAFTAAATVMLSWWKRRLGQQNNSFLWRGESHRMVWVGRALEARFARRVSRAKLLPS